MSPGSWPRRFGRGTVAIALAIGLLPAFASRATGESSLRDLQSRMDQIQEQLDATTERIERLRTQADEARLRIAEIETRVTDLERRSDALEVRAEVRADALYRDGGTGMLEVLFSADDFSELTDRAQLLSTVSQKDAGVFTELARSKLELRSLARDLESRREQLTEAGAALAEESKRLQGQFESASRDYEDLKERLLHQASSQQTGVPAAAVPAASAAVVSTGGMTCPVAGPVSFVDSWGAPRDGHTHQGVDMMAGYGTPVVAITSGTITYAAYNGSGGNMIFLSGSDGNAYWYMHNQDNLVSGGQVSVGQQIATVGDTGNATGTPHLHFEYHPGGGAAVNPYPLVASLC